jgi:hypothetical protein
VIRVLAGAVAFAVVLVAAPTAHADNSRLNNAIVADVYAVQRQAGCDTNVRVEPTLRLAAQWHAQDLIADPGLDGDIGSDGSTPKTRRWPSAAWTCCSSGTTTRRRSRSCRTVRTR